MGILGWSATKVKALAVLLVLMVLEAGTIACFEYHFAGSRPAPSLADSRQNSFASTSAYRPETHRRLIRHRAVGRASV